LGLFAARVFGEHPDQPDLIPGYDEDGQISRRSTLEWTHQKQAILIV